MISETDKELLLSTAALIAQARKVTSPGGSVTFAMTHKAAERLARVLREAAEGGWRPISEEARQADRILIAWAPFSNIPAHVELGWWSGRAQVWVNTYGRPFSGAPDAWMPLPAYPPPSPEPATHSLEPRNDD